jgi:hypothetical protein
MATATATPILAGRFNSVLGNGRGCEREEAEALAYKFDAERGVETWRLWKDGPRHRLDGPAQIVTLPDGSRDECWFADDKLYRADGGPVFIRRAANGRVIEQLWYEDGHFVGPPKRARRFLRARACSH